LPFDVCHDDVLEELVDFQSQWFLVAETAAASRPMIVEDVLGDVTRCWFHFDAEFVLLL